MSWQGLPGVDGVVPLNDADNAVVSEIRDVLAKHGALDRFGLALLHSHFEVSDDEVLVESVDLEARSLVVRPMPLSEVVGSLRPTVFRLTQDAEAVITAQYCHRPPGSLVHAR